MEKGDTNENQHVDVEFIQEKLDEGYNYTEEAKGRDLVLVIGNTGVGKSTTCNYLLGYKMKGIKYKGLSVIETVDKTNIKIGHEVISETLYAKSILINDKVCLLDCPGFWGNRSIEEKVTESVSTELAIRSARQIKGILILISVNVLKETRVAELRDLVKILISLFRNPVEMVKYSLFIITKKDRRDSIQEAEEITIGAMESLKSYCKEQIERLSKHKSLKSSENLTCVDYDKIGTYFTAVLEKRDNIIFIDPLDHGQSRKLIFDMINNIETRKGGLSVGGKGATSMSMDKIRPITINDFNFSEYDGHRVLFNKALYHLAGDGYKLLHKIRQQVENIQKYLLDISDSKERISKLCEAQSAIEEDLQQTAEGKSDHLKRNFESLKSWKSMINQNNKRIKSKKRKIEEIYTKKEELNEERDRIDNDTPLKFVEKSVYEMITPNLVGGLINMFTSLFHWVEMVFSANTGDSNIPIIRVDRTMQNGKWVDEEDRRENGIYNITYQSKYLAKPAQASVITYIKTRDESGNKINLERIESEYEQLKKEQKDLKAEVNEIKSSNETLKSNIEEVETNAKGYENTLRNELEKCKNDTEHYESEIIQKENAIKEAKISASMDLEAFNKNQRKYTILVNINTLLQFQSSLVTLFISEYDAFLVNLNDYRCCINEDGVINIDSFTVKEERIFGLKDPITGNEIKDLVITSEGTPFDEHSLLKQFDTTNPRNIPPFLFKRGDGSIETIKYRNWHKMNKQQYQKHHSSNKSSPQFSTFTKSEIVQMSVEQLQNQKSKIAQEIKKIKEQWEIKEVEMEQINQQLESLLLEKENQSEGEN